MIRTPNFSLILLALFLGFATASAQTNATREGTLSPTAKSQNSKEAQVAQLPPTDDSARTNKSEEKPEATKRVDKAARDKARQQYKAGLKYGRANLFRQAVQSFQQAIDSDPSFPDAYYHLGEAYVDLEDYEKAIAAFEKTLKLDPQAVDAFTALGQAYTKLNETKHQSTSERAASPDPVSASTGISSEAKETSAESPGGEQDQTRIYRVGAGDVLDIRLPGGASDESTLFTVSGSGQLDHPIVGHALNVAGLTTDEIGAQLNTELKKRSIGSDATSQVAVRDYNSHTVLVSGLVKEPGTKILRREAIPLYVVLADAQPLPEAALATVISRTPVKSRIVNLADAEQTSLLVQPGDVVTVQPAVKQFFYVGGDVKSPGELSFRPGLSLTQAILSAGGIKFKGDKVQLTRGRGNGLLTTQEFKLKDINKGKTPDPLVEPGDRITVLP